MADEDLSPLPFHRERNLSNRNFNKRNSRRRISTGKPNSIVPGSANADINDGGNNNNSENNNQSSSSSSFQISYSVNSDTESAFNRRSLLKMRPAKVDVCEVGIEAMPDPESPTSPGTNGDPALLDVRQKVQRFETLKSRVRYQKEERHSLKLLGNRHNNFLFEQEIQPHQPPNTPTTNIKTLLNKSSTDTTSSSNDFEVRSEDEVDQITDYEADFDAPAEYTVGGSSLPATPYCPEEPASKSHSNKNGDQTIDHEVDPDFTSALNNLLVTPGLRAEVANKNKTRQEHAQRSFSAEQSSDSLPSPLHLRNENQFPRNYRSHPRRKTEIIATTNTDPVGKFHSLYNPKTDEDEGEIELRAKSDTCVHPILEELIHTEEAYVKNLFAGLDNYGHMFLRKDLPLGLRGKKYDLFGNIEQIAEFHRDEFLPMLQRNRHDLKCLFEEFLVFLDQNCFYGYVIFTMNKQKSLKLCDLYKNYFISIQRERDDKLGINSFLVQPIQRMARYPLLLTQFINTFFKNRDIVMKPLIESCCRLEKRLRTLLITTNESEVINDIVDCNEFNVYYQGKFRKVSEFHVFDHKQKRSYRSKVFIFDKCIIYTEIKGKKLIFHGRYPCEHIGISAKTKSFTLYYERRKQQECEFTADASQIIAWLDLIRDMINNYANEERQKLQERYSRENDHMHRKAPSFSLYRDSNRFSSDSGIGNIYVMPKPDEEVVNNRSTWYANT